MKVFLHDEIHPEAVKYLEEQGEIIDDWSRIDEVDGIVVRKIKLDKETIDRAKNLKVIGFHGAGVNGIDLEEARKRNITVFAVPGLNADSVAELNVALALDMAHMISKSYLEIREGNSMKDALHRFRGHEIGGKVAGMIGFGQIGTRTAKILRESFHMTVMAYSRSLTKEKAEENGVLYADSMEEVMRKADFVFLALPCNAETEYMICKETLEWMKPTAVLINTARGKLVKEADLYQALKEEKIAGAAADVFEKEPLEPGNLLITLPNFLATPHIGGNTQEALYRVGMGVVTGIYDRLKEAEHV